MSDRISVDERIHPGRSFTSPSGEYTLILQEDSNLVLYRGEEPLWASNTMHGEGESSENKSLILQSDGNFVLYNADGDAIWASGSNYEAAQPYVLVQDDGNVCLYDEEIEGCHWTTDTAQ